MARRLPVLLLHSFAMVKSLPWFRMRNARFCAFIHTVAVLSFGCTPVRPGKKILIQIHMHTVSLLV